MGLHRHLQGILARTGLSDGQVPDGRAWERLSLEFNALCRSNDEKLFLLERLLQVRTSEVQSLYQDLQSHREQLELALGALPLGFVLFDREGRGLLQNPAAEEWLGTEATALNQHQLVSEPGWLRLADGSQLAADYRVWPLRRQGQLRGSFITFRPWSAEQGFEDLEKVASNMLETALTPHQTTLVRSILHQCREGRGQS